VVYRGANITQGGRKSCQQFGRDIKLKDPSLNYRHFSGHCLRRGFLTSAWKEKADLLKLIAQSRHWRVDTVLGYIDNAERFDNHAAERLLLSSKSHDENVVDRPVFATANNGLTAENSDTFDNH
jgi:hypothetical protein